MDWLLSPAPLTVNKVVAVSVEQAQISVTIITVITINVMNLNHIVCRERKFALIAFAALPLQELDHPQGFKGVSHQPLCPVNPIAVERAFWTNDFRVPSDGGLVVIVEVVCAIAEADFAQMLPPVTTVTPLPPFTWVTEQRPAFEFVEELFGYPVENCFGTTAAKVIGPAPDDGIEFANQASLRSAAII